MCLESAVSWLQPTLYSSHHHVRISISILRGSLSPRKSVVASWVAFYVHALHMWMRENRRQQLTLCRIPLEIKAEGQKVPLYEESFEDIGRPNDQPALPFNAFGTLAWARSEFENNSASSQIFWLLKESELTPSGANLLDGRYAVFGYIVEV